MTNTVFHPSKFPANVCYGRVNHGLLASFNWARSDVIKYMRRLVELGNQTCCHSLDIENCSSSQALVMKREPHISLVLNFALVGVSQVSISSLAFLLKVPALAVCSSHPSLPSPLLSAPDHECHGRPLQRFAGILQALLGPRLRPRGDETLPAEVLNRRQ